MPNLSIASQLAFSLAALEAQALESKNIDTEHLFLGLCKVEDILSMDRAAIPNIEERDWMEAQGETRDLKDFLESRGFDPKKARRRLRRIIHESQMEKGEFSGHRTPRCREVFAIAERLCQDEGEKWTKLKHLFLAVLVQHSPSLDILFSDLSVDKDEFIAGAPGDEGLQKTKTMVMAEQELRDKEKEEALQPKKTKTPFLDKFGRDLTRLAKEGKLDPCIGRKEEIRKVAQILAQKKKNNPILVGDAGVGKTCIVEGLALRVVEPGAPSGISNLRIVELSMGSLVAGTKYRGEFEERLETLTKEASLDPNIVLFIDEIHTMVGAGAAGSGGMDAGNILKPALARGTIKCIGATTTAEYRKYIEKDSALERRFQMVWVDEPTREEAILILKGLRPKFEEYHKLKIPDEVIEKAVGFSMRYLTDFRLPDKAIDIIDQACARNVLKTLSPGELKKDEVITEITVKDVARVVSERCRVPVEGLTVEESERLLRMEEHLRQRVMGQDLAIKEVAETIRSAKAGIKDPRKPMGVFLFLGSTGTGKTELAKALVEFLFHDESRLIVFDMSEYQEKHTVAKLIGAPPGYVGYEEEGQLTGKVRTHPYSVVLFDEVEKAHPEIFDIFLQIFDEGRLTDAHGRRVNFSEAVIILTSNLGSSVISLKRPIGVDIEKKRAEATETISPKRPMGVSLDEEKIEDAHEKWEGYKEQIYQAVNKTFRPEFLNRIQKKVIFYPLGRETVERIIEKIVKDLNQRLTSKSIQMVLSDSAVGLLMDKGYNEAYGAREIQRIFEQYIAEPLSQMILKGEVNAGQIVRASASGDGIQFEVT